MPLKYFEVKLSAFFEIHGFKEAPRVRVLRHDAVIMVPLRCRTHQKWGPLLRLQLTSLSFQDNMPKGKHPFLFMFLGRR